jgi:uncharacterized protein (TIGR03435 family)
MKHNRKDLDKTLREHLLLFEKDAVRESDMSRERIWERLKRRTPVAVIGDSSRNTRQFSRQLTPARIVACFVAMLLVSAVVYRAIIRPDDLYAIVETIGGSVVQISQGKALAARVGDKIAVDTPVRTGSGAEAKLRLPDGSRIEMQPESELSLQRGHDGLHIQLKEGSVSVTPAEEAVGKLFVQNREQLVPVLGALVQTAPTPIQSEATPKWEVVSIKPCEFTGGLDGARGGGDGNGPAILFSADRMTLRCQTTWQLIMAAYVQYANAKNDLYAFEVVAANKGLEGGPAWINGDFYTIEAKAEKPVDRDVMQGPMLQTLLEDRFKLKLRREVREIPLLALTVAKGGPKMKPHQEGTCTPRGQGQRGAPPPGVVFCRNVGGARGYEAEGLTLEQFSKSPIMVGIMYQEHKPVIDKTGLAGKFDFKIERKDVPENTGRPEVGTGQQFIDAIEDQLGLKLEKTKGPWEYLIIDHLERPLPN